MSGELPEPGAARERTATRMRFVAPPGMEVERSAEPTTIGRYEIIETLGKGAMGVVYKARDPLLDRIVAVKTIVSPKHGGRRVRRAYLERFEREAKAAAKMQHPAIVTIFDVGSTDDGAPFMVLEYLPGESLADRLDRVRVPLAKAVQIGVDLASALGFAHKLRIVHRDVKPANVLHAGENRWKLADFGIARMPDSDLTQVGIFMGTPGYAPPEAISNGSYTTQADVFAWGAVLYELLSGRIAYEGPDTQTTNSYVLKNTAPPPTHYDPSIPGPLADVVMRALHPSTEVRFNNGSEAEHALQKAWELCLASNLVAPSSLVGQEIPHARAPRAFHKPMSMDSTAKPTPKSIGDAPSEDGFPGLDIRADSGDATIRRDHGDFDFGNIEQALAAEAEKGDGGRTPPDTLDPMSTAKTLPGGSVPSEIDAQPTVPAKAPANKVGAGTAVNELIAQSAAPAGRAETGRVKDLAVPVKSPGAPTWIAVIVLAVLAGTAAAYLLLNL